MSDGDITVGEVARTVQGALIKMESLAGRLESGQFVNSDVFRTYKELQDTKLNNLEAKIKELEDDKKWMYRLVIGFVILGVLGAWLATGGLK